MENENITNKERLKQKSRDIRVLYLKGNEAIKDIKRNISIAFNAGN